MKDFSKALNYAFLLLKYRARSRFEIISRFKQKGYPSSTIEEVIKYLEENRYIDDKEFVDIFVSNSLDKGWGPRRIDFNLKKLGICPNLRKRALSPDIDYSKKIREIIKKKVNYYQRMEVPQKKIWQRIVRALAAKGFSYSDIFQEMEKVGVKRFED